MLGHMVVLFSFLRNLHTLFYSGCINTNSARAVPFLHTLSSIIVCRLFDEGHSDRYEVISHCGFDLHFCNSERCSVSSHVFVSHLYVFFGETSV